MRLEFFDPLDAFNDKPQVVQLLLLRIFEETLRRFMERDVVAPGRKIDVLRIRLPDYVHAEDFLIKLFCLRDIAHLESDMAHALKPADLAHGGTIAQQRAIPGLVDMALAAF